MGIDQTEAKRANAQNKPVGDGPGLERLRASPKAEVIRDTVVAQQSAAMETAGKERIATEASAGAASAEAAPAKPARPARRKPAKTTAPAPAAAASAEPEAAGHGAATEEKTDMNANNTAAARKSRFTGRTKAAAKAAKGARKAPGKKAAAAARGRVPRIQEDAHITKLFSENPRREGSKKHKDYEILKKVTTVAGFLKAGGKRATLNSAVRRKHIKVG